MADAYLNIDKQTLDLIKYPPLYSPAVAYGSDYNYSSNKLRGKLFQFCYRYIYDTKMKSVFSPYSEVVIPQGEELPNGDFVPDFHLNNYIEIKLLQGHHTVKEIEVAYRIGNEGNLYVFDRLEKIELQSLQISGTVTQGSPVITNIGQWGGVAASELKVGMEIRFKIAGVETYPYIIAVNIAENTITLSKIIDTGLPVYNITSALWVASSENIYSIFRNDKVDYVVPTQEAIESFDGVPITARSMEVIESNRIVVGGPKTGYDNVELDVAATVTHEEKADYFSKFEFTKEYSYNVSGTQKIFLRVPDTLVDKDYYFINFLFLNRITALEVPISVGYFYNTTSGDTPEDIITYLVNALVKYNTVTSPFNFKARSLVEEITEFPLIPYSSSGNYGQGTMVSYNTRIYLAATLTSNHAPSGTTSNNDYWNYLCEISERDRVFIMRLLPLGSTNTTYNFQLKSYGASIFKAQQVYSIAKYGNRVNVAIEYLDYAGRLGAANINDQLAVDIPYLDGLPSLYSFNNLVNTIELSIRNRPPDWAHAYRILIDRNIPWFFQFFFYGPAHANPDITDDNIHWKINVNRAIQNLRDYIPKATLSPYIFEKGDRLRLIAYQEAYHTTQPLNRWQKYVDVMDVEVIGYDYPETVETYLKDDGDGSTEESKDYILDANGNKIREVSTGYIITEKFNAPDSSTIPFNDSIYILYEIYRPRKVSDENTSYWETSETLAILDPGTEERRHKGDQLPSGLYDPTRDQTSTDLIGHPAKVKLNSGNVYRKMRYSGEADIYFPVESLSLSDFYESNAISIGRLNVISKDLGQIDEENAYMASGIVLEDTAINQLNKFPTQNKWRLQSKHGAIHALLEKGFILYAFQDTKISSIYIGRSSMVDPSDGSERVNMISNAIFGTVRPDMSSNFGCVDPKSISMSHAHVYFWDGNNSKWCRIAYNGIFPIADYGKSKFFLDLNASMKLTSNKHSISVFDNKFDELIISQQYQEATDYELSVVGQYVIGTNKFTGIGRTGGNTMASLSVGMILTGLTSAETTPEVNLTIIKLDVPNRIIYFDRTIPFGVGITGPVEVTALILKKYNMQTMAFHESANAWKTRYPFAPELMVSYGDELLSFMKGYTFIHNSNLVPYNNFYGVQFEQFIQFAFSADPNMIKLFNGIEVLSDHKWGMESKGDVKVKAYDNRGMDMESKLPMVKLMRNVEGKYFASFLRDMNTPGSDTEVYKLVNGRFLRGHTIVLKLSNFEVTKVVLFEVGIYFTQSL